MATETSAGRLNNTSKEPSWQLIILYFPVASLTFEASCLQYDHVKYHKHFTGSGGYTNVLKIDLKCPEKYIKAYIFFLLSNGLSSNLKMLNTLAYS
jgi:hypothetical protein